LGANLYADARTECQQFTDIRGKGKCPSHNACQLLQAVSYHRRV
jgi:hypothetical protein